MSDEHDEAWMVARALAQEVEWRHRHHQEMTKLSGKAIDLASKASAFEGEALKAYRDLMQALADNAGRERPVRLGDALATARAILDTHTREEQA